MSRPGYPYEAGREPHSISLKVLRLARPSLAPQHAYASPYASDLVTGTTVHPSHPAELTKANPASLAYPAPQPGSTLEGSPAAAATHDTATNPEPFLLSPILALPPSFGTAHVGEVFACTLCANHEMMGPVEGTSSVGAATGQRKTAVDVRIEAEMKTPASLSVSAMPSANPSAQGAGAVRLALTGVDGKQMGNFSSDIKGGEILEPGRTLQRNLSFDLKEEGNHVLAVTVSYYEKTETSGRTRTFRKLYQFMCKASVIVRTKCTPLPTWSGARGAGQREKKKAEKRRLTWVLEAQLENCSEGIMQLEHVGLDLDPGIRATGCNSWTRAEASTPKSTLSVLEGRRRKPLLHPTDVEQVAFIVEEEEPATAQLLADGRVVFGSLEIGWRNEMGNRGFLSTGKLAARMR